MADQDPTQTGGQEQNTERNDARLSAEEQIAARVNAAQAEDLVEVEANEQGDLQYVRDEKGRFASPEEAAAPEPEEPAPVAAPAPAPEPAPVEVRKRTITVDGQTIEVEESRLIEAGTRLLQKETAADKRLQEAARIKREAEEYAARVGHREPSQDAPSQALSQEVPSPATFSPEMLDSVLETKIYNREAQKAAESFRKEFPEIAADPHLMNMAATLENQRLSTVTALGESLGDPFEAYRSHGVAIQQWLGKYKPVATSEEKVERKRTITAVPAASAKAPAPQDDKPPTIQQIIAEERKSRQGRPVPNRSH